MVPLGEGFGRHARGRQRRRVRAIHRDLRRWTRNLEEIQKVEHGVTHGHEGPDIVPRDRGEGDPAEAWRDVEAPDPVVLRERRRSGLPHRDGVGAPASEERAERLAASVRVGPLASMLAPLLVVEEPLGVHLPRERLSALSAIRAAIPSNPCRVAGAASRADPRAS
jgi:hypothetical protein